MPKTDIRADFTDWISKRKHIAGIDPAIRYFLTKWSTETVLKLKRAASGGIVGKYKSGRKSGQLHRNVAYKITGAARRYNSEIGTGVGATKEVVYADILDQGKYSKRRDGIIRPVRKQYLTIPFPEVRGWARSYPDAFFVKSKAGNLVLARRKGKGIEPLFLLKKEVEIPAFKWFSLPLSQQLPILDQYLRPSSIISQAKKMSGGR